MMISPGCWWDSHKCLATYFSGFSENFEHRTTLFTVLDNFKFLFSKIIFSEKFPRLFTGILDHSRWE